MRNDIHLIDFVEQALSNDFLLANIGERSSERFVENGGPKQKLRCCCHLFSENPCWAWREATTSPWPIWPKPEESMMSLPRPCAVFLILCNLELNNLRFSLSNSACVREVVTVECPHSEQSFSFFFHFHDDAGSLASHVSAHFKQCYSDSHRVILRNLFFFHGCTTTIHIHIHTHLHIYIHIHAHAYYTTIRIYNDRPSESL